MLTFTSITQLVYTRKRLRMQPCVYETFFLEYFVSNSFFAHVIKSDGSKIPILVIMPVIKLAGVTSNAGFQHVMPSAAILLSFM